MSWGWGYGAQNHNMLWSIPGDGATYGASFSRGLGAQGKPGSNSGAHPRSSGWWSFLLLPVPARKPPPMGPGGGFGRDGAAPFGLSALLRPLVVPLAVVG